MWWLTAVAACTTTWNQTGWIQGGKTTEKEIVTRYGDPDLVQVSATGKLVTYRPTAQKDTPIPIEIPSIKPGPFGTTAPTMEPLERPLGAHSAAAHRYEWIQKKIRIRYDEHGVVQEVLP